MISRGFARWGLFLTYSGGGDIYLGREVQSVFLSGDSSFLLPPHTPVHYHRNLYVPSWDFYFLDFDLPPVLEDLSLPCLEPLPLVDRCRIICEGLADEIAWNRPERDLRLDRGLLDILDQLAFGGREESDGIEKTLSWMHAHPDGGFDLPGLLDMSGSGRTEFFKGFRERTGRTPHRYFSELKIEAARSLLETTNLKVAAIAERLGFCDEYYFSRQFKKISGVSPRQWRQLKNHPRG